jgi:hypothetical protein
MPYRHAHWALLLLLAVSFYAFWPSYFTRLGSTEWQLHVHGLTATAWMALLVAQSWAIHGGYRALHRSAGLSMLLLVPLFTMGGLLVVQTMVSGDGVFAQVQGPRLAFVDGASTFAFAAFTYLALAERRRVHRHAGWLLATPVMLVMPVVTRILPGSLFPGVEPMPRFTMMFDIASAVALGIALWVAWRHPKGRTPFLAVAAVTLVQWAGYHLVPSLPAWGSLMAALRTAPVTLVASAGLLLGAAAMLLGWRAVPPLRARAA